MRPKEAKINELAHTWKKGIDLLNGEVSHDQHIAWRIGTAFGNVDDKEVEKYPTIREIITLTIDLHWQEYTSDERQEKWKNLIELLDNLEKS